MTDFYKQTITINKLSEDEERVEIKNKSDYISYRTFLEYFSSRNSVTKTDLIIGINFTYGWMPTMFEFKNTDKLEEVVELLDKAHKGQTLSVEELELMKSCLNNSIVGSSKLLHFVNPRLYPIWDSRVHYYLNKDLKKKARLDLCSSYLDFMDFCHFITNENGFNPIQYSIESKVGYAMTPIRTAELIMYHNGAIPKKAK